MKRKTPVFSLLVAFAALGFYGECTAAATATNLVTICTSAKAVTQASKCTAWQYNVYSPAAFIESYPQVSPGPASYTDPAYEYRLGSTITPNMGVKVCPTALVPGTSYTSAAADPCPGNKLVVASTVIGQPEYVITPATYGIAVTQIWEGSAVPVAGSPFVENPLVISAAEEANPPAILSPSVIALDPAGAYLYAYYSSGGEPDYYYSFQVQKDGSLKQVASVERGVGPCASCPGNITIVTASAHHLAVWAPQEGGEILLMSTNAGVITVEGIYSTINYLPGFVTSIQMDASEQWMYVNYSSTGGTAPDTVAVFSMQQLPSSLAYVTALPVGASGIQIAP